LKSARGEICRNEGRPSEKNVVKCFLSRGIEMKLYFHIVESHIKDGGIMLNLKHRRFWARVGKKGLRTKCRGLLGSGVTKKSWEEHEGRWPYLFRVTGWFIRSLLVQGGGEGRQGGRGPSQRGEITESRRVKKGP